MSFFPKTAMVLSAGLGTRMMPLTKTTPKPLIHVRDKALIDYTLDELAASKVETAIVNLHYLPDQIETHLKTRRQPAIIFSDEREELLETGGGLKKARTYLGEEPFFSTNTDAIFAGCPAGTAASLVAEHWQDHMLALLLLVPMERTTGFDGNGDFHMAEDGSLIKAKEEAAAFAFTGLQIIDPSLLDHAPDGPFSTRLLWEIAAKKNALFGISFPHHWLHVGTPEGVQLAEEKLETLQAEPTPCKGP